MFSDERRLLSSGVAAVMRMLEKNPLGLAKDLQKLHNIHTAISDFGVILGMGGSSKIALAKELLIDLDDVYHGDQSDALMPTKDSLGNDSFITVKNGKLGVLKLHYISSMYRGLPGQSSQGASQALGFYVQLDVPSI
ncbi:hypothetical protein SUGI_0196040 [Cryptomeria japonica]|nr:hypothetical protein SUGI_0196040 [Cryptomeria japonica]